MIIRGYDSESKALFSWDGALKFEGHQSIHSPDDLGQRQSEMIGSVFLSGVANREVFSVWWDGKETSIMGVHFKDGKCLIREVFPKNLQEIGPVDPICLCGSAVSDPLLVSRFCEPLPSNAVYVCPIIGELAALGALVPMVPAKPARLSFMVPNTDVMDAPSLEFDPKLDGDGFGRMADLVKRGVPVVNEMMKGLGGQAFYGRVIHNGKHGGGTYIIMPEDIPYYFGKEPLSKLMYAATCVTVRVQNTEVFGKETGCNESFVDVFVASPFLPGICDFMRFYRVMSGKRFVVSSAKDDAKFRKNGPVFRYNKGYRAEVENAG